MVIEMAQLSSIMRMKMMKGTDFLIQNIFPKKYYTDEKEKKYKNTKRHDANLKLWKFLTQFSPRIFTRSFDSLTL